MSRFTARFTTRIPTQITNNNIHGFVRNYCKKKSNLPSDLRQILIGKWDVSRVTNMKNLFQDLTTFNEPLNEWNVSNVTNMESMFENCQTFNQPLDLWNVGNVTNMFGMFSNCTDFNKPLDQWGLKVGNVTNMGGLFYDCKSFNQPLNTWNVSNVTNMEEMFYGCESFNQPLNSWNIGNVTRIEGIFRDSGMREENKPPGLPAPPRVDVDPNQIHKASSKINYDTLNKFFTTNNKTRIKTPSNYANYIQDTLTSFIDKSDVSETIKQDQTNGLQSIMDKHLIRLNYSHQSSQTLTNIVNALEYVKNQPADFQKEYVNVFIQDCVQAYEGSRGMTCAAGALERITLSLIPAIAAYLSTATIPNKEYQELIDIIVANPEKMIPDSIREWYKLHKKGTDGEFPPGTSEATKRANLKEYLLTKFPEEEALIDNKIAEISDNIGYEEDDFDVNYGGKRKRKTIKNKDNHTRPKKSKTLKNNTPCVRKKRKYKKN
jgi:surface protein